MLSGGNRSSCLVAASKNWAECGAMRVWVFSDSILYLSLEMCYTLSLVIRTACLQAQFPDIKSLYSRFPFLLYTRFGAKSIS